MATETHRGAYGVAASLTASTLFGAVFLISGFLGSRTDSETVVSWRVIVTCACYALLLAHPAARRMAGRLWRYLRSDPVFPWSSSCSVCSPACSCGCSRGPR